MGFFDFLKNKPAELPKGSIQGKRFHFAPLQIDRGRVDIKGWRDSLTEAESPLNPFRVKMQGIFYDTTLNEHLNACMEKRKDLTLLRKFKVCNNEGIENEDVTKLFNSPWFADFQSFALDALFYGYNLIQMGDIINESFPNLSFVRRQNVSPDRLCVSSFPYQLHGQRWDDSEFKDWYLYIKTPTETGISPCGYGLLYRIAKTEILLRANTGNNADYNEVYGNPLKVGKTAKQKEERDTFESALAGMGSNGYILLDKEDGENGDELELLEAKNSGTAYQTYDNFEQRLEKKISKIVLGHADALDSTPGKLGATSGEDNPAATALMEKQSKDAEFILPYINNELIPKMRNLGFNIPEGHIFQYSNDEEAEEFREREDQSNKATADIFKLISDAGGDPDWKYFSDRTGIPVMKKEEVVPIINDPSIAPLK